jgi:hypothetical protein
MSAQPKQNRAELQPSSTQVDLRQRVERLEFLRIAAVACHDTAKVEHIDKQIEQATREWVASFGLDGEEGVRKTA